MKQTFITRQTFPAPLNSKAGVLKNLVNQTYWNVIPNKRRGIGTTHYATSALNTCTCLGRVYGLNSAAKASRTIYKYNTFIVL